LKLLPHLLVFFILIAAYFFNNLGEGWGFYHNAYSLFLILSCLIALFSFLLLSHKTLSFSSIDIILGIGVTYLFFNAVLLNHTKIINENVISLCYLSLLYVLLKIVPTPTLSSFFPVGLMLIGLCSALHGVVQFTFAGSTMKEFNVIGSFGNPAPYSGYLVSLVPIILSIVLFANARRSSWVRISTIIALFLICFVLLVTKSRAAYASILVSATFIFCNKHSFFNKYKKQLLVICFLLTLTLIPLKLNSSFGRILIWEVSFKMWQSKPFLGLGLGEFAVQYNNYQADHFRKHSNSPYELLADNTYNAFNEFIEVAVELGVIGLVLFLILLYFVFLKKYENEKEMIYFKASILSICVFALFSYPFSSVIIKIILLVNLAILSNNSGRQLRVKVTALTGMCILTVVVICSGILYLQTFERYKAINLWKEGNELVIEGDSIGWKKYKVAYENLKNHGGFLYNYGAELHNAGYFYESANILEQARPRFSHVDLLILLGNCYKGLKQFDKAEVCYQTAAYMIPNRLFTNYLLVKLYLEQNRVDEAVAVAKKIVDMKPKVRSSLANEIKDEMIKFIQSESKKK
jgi:O-antigen polymerase